MQIDWGVRVDELHHVSPSAAYIHPGIAKRLQDLWDEGSNLLSLLDDRCACAVSDCYDDCQKAAQEEGEASNALHNMLTALKCLK